MPTLLELGRYSADALSQDNRRTYQPAYWVDDVQMVTTGNPVPSLAHAISIANARVRELAQLGV